MHVQLRFLRSDTSAIHDTSTLVEKVTKEGGCLGYLKQVNKDIKRTDRHVELDEEKGRGLVYINRIKQSLYSYF